MKVALRVIESCAHLIHSPWNEFSATNKQEETCERYQVKVSNSCAVRERMLHGSQLSLRWSHFLDAAAAASSRCVVFTLSLSLSLSFLFSRVRVSRELELDESAGANSVSVWVIHVYSALAACVYLCPCFTSHLQQSVCMSLCTRITHIILIHSHLHTQTTSPCNRRDRASRESHTIISPSLRFSLLTPRLCAASTDVFSC